MEIVLALTLGSFAALAVSVGLLSELNRAEQHEQLHHEAITSGRPSG